MFWVLIGHRGVGKTQLIERMQISGDFEASQFISLDQAIEKKLGKSIPQIFREDGEEGFRQLERKTFLDIYANRKGTATVVDLGAGFQGEIPEDVKVLWVQRTTSPEHFRFLNRPALDSTPEEARHRFRKRQERYASLADFSLELMEGDFHETIFESHLANFLLQGVPIPVGSEFAEKKLLITLLNSKHARFHLEHRVFESAGFELRDDLLSFDEIKVFLQSRPNSLVSLRKSGAPTRELIKENSEWDHPLEWGVADDAPILSLHTRRDSFLETLQSLPTDHSSVIKLAVSVASFTELLQGYRWQQEQPEKRVFLPRSEDGRWSWFRSLTTQEMPFQFVREAGGSAPDQPTLQQLTSKKYSRGSFAALLGDPVKHSVTPSFHQSYFAKKQSPVVSIPIQTSEFEEALFVLTELGLKWAAVTAPLKEVAAQWAGASESSVNTLYINEGLRKSANTDPAGFAALAVTAKPQESVAVWGGGGTLPAIAEVFPEASFYSSRTGDLKQGKVQESPGILVWAVGPQAFRDKGCFPPKGWNPERVLDLNYTADSPGITCAQIYGCQYHSGMTMFIEQAKKQQEFWDECEFK